MAAVALVAGLIGAIAGLWAISEQRRTRRNVPGMQIPSKGYAVEQDGTWKMARATYAELVGRLGITVPRTDTELPDRSALA
jgi:hypothetical protein